MPYIAEISRVQPTCFLFLIDQSASMEAVFGGDQQKKLSVAVADAINKILRDLVIKCSKGEVIRDYFEVSVIGYGSSVGPIFGGPLAGRTSVPIGQVATNPSRVEQRTRKMDDGAGGLVEQRVKFPVWFDPKAENGTPMCQALDVARQLLAAWISAHPKSYPPTVINITDGEPSDGDPLPVAEALTDLATADGNVLLFNCHISASSAAPTVFPASESGLADEAARRLFQMSSVLPPKLWETAQMQKPQLESNARGFAFNADLVELVQFLDIGTRPSNLR